MRRTKLPFLKCSISANGTATYSKTAEYCCKLGTKTAYNDIYGKCLNSEGTERLYCLAYITGSFDQLDGSEEYECVDIEKVSAGQIRDVVIAYLRKKPESRHFSAASLVRNAIYYAFCE